MSGARLLSWGEIMASELAGLASVLAAWDPWRELADAVVAGQDVQIFGLAGSLPAVAVAGLAALERPLLVVCPGFVEARRLGAEVAQLLEEPGRVVLLPPRPVVHGAVTAESREWERLRLEALGRIRSDGRVVAVVPAEAARQRQVAVDATPVVLAPGDPVDRPGLLERLAALGYERVPLVEVGGQFALRGGVLDVFPPGDAPLRLQIWDDVVESVAVFDATTQRIVGNRPRAVLGPARELLWSEAERERGFARLSEEVRQAVDTLFGLGRADAARAVRERWAERLGGLWDGRGWPGIERFGAAFGPMVPLTRLFRRAPVVVFDDRERVAEAVRGRALEDQAEIERKLERGEWLPVEGESVIPTEAFFDTLTGHAQVTLSLLPHQRTHGQRVWSLAGRPAPRAHGQWDLLSAEIQRLRKARHRVVLAVKDEETRNTLIHRLVDAAVPVRPGIPAPGEVGILVGQLAHGFVLADLGLAVLTETEITGHDVRPEARRTARARGPSVRLAELTPGDYVVHVTHGIGRFLGIRTLEAGGQRRDYLHIAYAGDDSLYVPVDQLDLVQRYQGPDDRPPKLSRLGGAEWSRAKERVKASVRELAEGLIKLYAARQARPGFAFGPDTPWQRDFEAAFPYEETPDQLRATEEIKRDMEAPRPMDRLLLGDVGYGKTEVALRAAFKAIMAGKQVAMLVPTTLLAEQHFATARARMAGFPIEVEVLSRFRSPADQRAVLEGLKDGRVDFVIGTHRLLGKDVAFRDLGLLIIDEEHRFGVAHKERIKQLKETVDVLTLSATPIPRTLHMTMVGIRDVSVIETPPEDRFPVETIVAAYDEDLIREAIRRELERDGQVYYVQNRIAAMEGTLSRLRRLLPDARIAVAHGKMDEDQLEDVMARFLNQEYDILLATSIIESGLDIPNVNTLIVEDADRLGLAQLYQLRGRVGRSARLAYAYFTYRPDRTMTPEAEQRLAAIRDFTELGAGYQIALRDLEIRGAGNLLGPEQHGFVAAVGFELYTALLAEAVAELKGEPTPDPVETALEFDVNAYLPDEYIDDHRQKIALYKRLVGARDLDAVDDLGREMAERYGPPPEPVLHLLRLARMRVMARQLGLAQVTQRGDRLVFRLAQSGRVGPEAVVALGRKYPGRLIQMSGKAPELGLKLASRSARDVLETALDVLETMRGAS